MIADVFIFAGMMSLISTSPLLYYTNVLRRQLGDVCTELSAQLTVYRRAEWDELDAAFARYQAILDRGYCLEARARRYEFMAWFMLGAACVFGCMAWALRLL